MDTNPCPVCGATFKKWIDKPDSVALYNCESIQNFQEIKSSDDRFFQSAECKLSEFTINKTKLKDYQKVFHDPEVAISALDLLKSAQEYIRVLEKYSIVKRFLYRKNIQHIGYLYHKALYRYFLVETSKCIKCFDNYRICKLCKKGFEQLNYKEDMYICGHEHKVTIENTTPCPNCNEDQISEK